MHLVNIYPFQPAAFLGATRAFMIMTLLLLPLMILLRCKEIKEGTGELFEIQLVYTLLTVLAGKDTNNF